MIVWGQPLLGLSGVNPYYNCLGSTLTMIVWGMIECQNSTSSLGDSLTWSIFLLYVPWALPATALRWFWYLEGHKYLSYCILHVAQCLKKNKIHYRKKSPTPFTPYYAVFNNKNNKSLYFLIKKLVYLFILQLNNKEKHISNQKKTFCWVEYSQIPEL